MTEFEIPLPGSGAIGATRWECQCAHAVVLLHPATAVTQRYYFAFAEYLSGRGFHVLTYDYRGTGRSAPRRMRDAATAMSDWIEDDVGAITRWAEGRERRQIAPRDGGVPAIGHMGFFRKRCAGVLWPQVADWLLSHSGARAQSACAR